MLAQLPGTFGRFGAAFAPFNLPGPALPPRPAAPPSLQFAVPPGACGLACTALDLLTANPAFTTLVAALQAASLTERLSGPDPITVFAPTNAAFELVQPARLQVRPEPAKKWHKQQ